MLLGTHMQRAISEAFETPGDYREKRYMTADEPRLCEWMSRCTTTTARGDRDPKPWPTLVLGTGCNGAGLRGKSLRGVCEALKLQGRAYVARWGEEGERRSEINGQEVVDVVYQFANDLVTARIGDGEDTPPGGVLGEKLDEEKLNLLFDLLLAAALVSKVFHNIMALGYTVPRRCGWEDVATVKGAPRGWGFTHKVFVTPARDTVAMLAKKAGSIPAHFIPAWHMNPPAERTYLQKQLKKLFAHIHSGLPENVSDACTVEIADLRMLVEFAWYSLMTSVPEKAPYRGWSDLMLELSSFNELGKIGRPLFNFMSKADKLIAKRFRACDSSEEPDEIYKYAAELLARQYARQEAEEETPVAAAFVTAFDIELERSLKKQEVLAHFTMVLPVWVSLPGLPYGRACWIAGKVTSGSWASDGLPNPETWRFFKAVKADDGPLVVRLAGCPTIALPDRDHHEDLFKDIYDELRPFFNASGGSDKQGSYKNGFSLEHAVVINEHDALLQNDIDLFSVPGLSFEALKYCGLPPDVASDSDNFARFWILLGTQLRDSAIRHRLSTVISSLSQLHYQTYCCVPPENITTEGDQDDQAGRDQRAGALLVEQGPPIRGVAVNMNLTEVEEDLLMWKGIDIVYGNVSDFKSDLEHCALHYHQDKPFTQACGL